MIKMIRIEDYAKFVIYYMNANGLFIGPHKLQKILYFTQAWHLVNFNQHPLFEEQPEAWMNGPNYRSIYNIYKKYWTRNKDIIPPLEEGKDYADTCKELMMGLGISTEQEAFINELLQEYGTMTNGMIIYLSHVDKPWNETREGIGVLDSCIRKISFERMYECNLAKYKKDA
ncbi:putative phage-associated protein [Chitinophaga skermanii]|uniref:Putative phage-associated protein n=1 Tax=Chitinophaga skermanii TaxID=331697 RepID=A0A327QNY4_9BACT|nr:type II toxin-antitoxin system antitoxin SocA domain-containing protein [Chitinophaga skermanii]RAJ05362.1 putative phage-associated protein [Chitinophaga skermanii]